MLCGRRQSTAFRALGRHRWQPTGASIQILALTSRTTTRWEHSVEAAKKSLRISLEPPYIPRQKNQVEPADFIAQPDSKFDQVEKWMGKDITTIQFPRRLYDNLRVTSRGGFDVIGTFNTVYRTEKDPYGALYIPGVAPVWREDVVLPVEKPSREEYGFVHKNTKYDSLVEKNCKFLWAAPVKAIREMSPDFRFEDVDIAITAPRLRSLMDVCRFRESKNFAANMTLINRTLFIDGFDLVGTEGGSQADSTTGFSRLMSTWPEEVADSAAHYRVLRYKLGMLNCIVVAGVDTVSPPEQTQAGEDPCAKAAAATEFVDLATSPLNVERLWISRINYFIQGLMEAMPDDPSKRLFTNLKCQRAAGYFDRWENHERTQVVLQRLSWMLTKLRRAAFRYGEERPCVITKVQDPPGSTNVSNSLSQGHMAGPRPALLVSEATHDKYPMSDEDIAKLWLAGRTPRPQTVFRTLIK